MQKQSRRSFFRSFIRESLVCFEEARGHRHFALNKLRDLPKDLVSNIEPVFFNDGQWHIEPDCLLIYSKTEDHFRQYRPFSNEEQFIVKHFQRGLILKSISKKFAKQFDVSLEDAWRQVSKLFFELAELRVCHPAELGEIEAYFFKHGI